jgi:hypothetical protein
MCKDSRPSNDTHYQLTCQRINREGFFHGFMCCSRCLKLRRFNYDIRPLFSSWSCLCLCWNIKHWWFITLLLDSVGWVLNLHLETVDRAIDQISTLVSQVVNMHVSQIVDHLSKIVGWWIDQPKNRLRIGCMDNQVKHSCQAEYTMQIWWSQI